MLKRGRNLFRRQYARLKRLGRLGSIGIIPRLAVAFMAVAALAAAANLIVENGISFIEQQRHLESERSANDSRAISSLRESMDRAQQIASSTQFLMALDRFDRAVYEHAETDSKLSAARYSGARRDLERELSKYMAEAHPDSTPQLPRLIDAHKRSAEAFMQLARARRGLLKEYSTVFSSMDVRLEASIDGEWKVLGHVVAGEALLKLRAQMAVLRDALAAHDTFGGGNTDNIALVKAEQGLADTLATNETALRRSQGSKWYQVMHEDMTGLLRARTSLLQAEPQRAAAAKGFVRETQKLTALLPKSLAVNTESAGAPGPSSTTQAAAATGTPALPEGPSRSFVAWMSAVVLLLLLYICFVTIFSIVRPVRRMVTATARLAKGENARVVASGGIRELDTLAVAFNSMAEQLAAARASTRNAHQRLEEKVAERTRQLQILAEQDPLTGLANRRHLFAALDETLERARLSGNRVGVFFLDIDNFKTLNDSLGHAYGDRVLVAIAQRLEVIARSYGFAARLGGDEFTIVHQGAASTEEILACGAAIIRAFDVPVQVDFREVIVSVSVGASVFPDHAQDAESLLRAADAALFRAKALGRSQLATFTPELLTTASAKFAIEQRLRRAIQKGEFELFYQPLVNAQTHNVPVVEALIRWRTPNGSFLAPGEFLAVAEESGLIMEISDWVLRTAIETAAQWHQGAWPDARVAINVSSRQFLNYRIRRDAREAAERISAACAMRRARAHRIRTADRSRDDQVSRTAAQHRRCDCAR